MLLATSLPLPRERITVPPPVNVVCVAPKLTVSSEPGPVVKNVPLLAEGPALFVAVRR